MRHTKRHLSNLMALVGREPQLEELARAAGLGRLAPTLSAGDAPAPLVVVYGGASTGKSAGAARVLRRRAAAFALVDCAAVFGAQDLYREALAQLYQSAADQQLQQPQPLPQAADGEAADGEAVVVVGDGGDAEAPAAFEGYAALNFLAFTKALGAFVEASGLPSGATVYLALDHVDKLLDRGLAALLTCVFTINEQLAFSSVRGASAPQHETERNGVV